MGGGDESADNYPAMTVETQAQVHGAYSPARVRAGLRKRKNWEQLLKFCFVGATGYAVNLAVYTVLLGVPLFFSERVGCRSYLPLWDGMPDIGALCLNKG